MCMTHFSLPPTKKKKKKKGGGHQSKVTDYNLTSNYLNEQLCDENRSDDGTDRQMGLNGKKLETSHENYYVLTKMGTRFLSVLEKERKG